MGCDPNGKDEQGNTPLNLAAAFGCLDMLIYLIEERKCSPECRGRWGRSPLHAACEYDNLDMVKYLVRKQGCKLNCKDHFNLTPPDLAITLNNELVINYLKDQMKMALQHIHHVRVVNCYTVIGGFSKIAFDVSTGAFSWK